MNLNQKSVLVDQVFNNFYVLLGTFQSSSGSKYRTKKWKEVAVILNEIGPARKSGGEWKKSFSNIKSKTKEKVGKIRRRRNQGLSSGIKFSEIDEKIVRMFGTNSLDGLKNIQEIGIRNRKIKPINIMDSFPEHGETILQRKKKIPKRSNTYSAVISNLSKAKNEHIQQSLEQKHEIIQILKDISSTMNSVNIA